MVVSGSCDIQLSAQNDDTTNIQPKEACEFQLSVYSVPEEWVPNLYSP